MIRVLESFPCNQLAKCPGCDKLDYPRNLKSRHSQCQAPVSVPSSLFYPPAPELEPATEMIVTVERQEAGYDHVLEHCSDASEAEHNERDLNDEHAKELQALLEKNEAKYARKRLAQERKNQKTMIRVKQHAKIEALQKALADQKFDYEQRMAQINREGHEQIT